MTTYAWVSVLAFGFSFLFALGGVGAAIVLVPVMHALGIPLNEARPTGLFVNTVSLSGATWDYIRNHRLDFRLGLPIIVTSAITAPVGAWSGRYLPERAVLLVFTMFLVFSAGVLLFFRSSKYEARFLPFQSDISLPPFP